MSGRNNRNNDEFRKYREVAPESVDDQTLRQIISDNNGNRDNIAAALDRLWSDVGNVPDWTVNSKQKKSQESSTQQKQQKQDKSRTGNVKSKDRQRPSQPNTSTPPLPSTTQAAPKPTAPTAVKQPTPKPSTDSWAKSSALPTPTAPAWGSGESLADRIKKKEEADRLAALAAEVVESINVSEAEPEVEQKTADVAASPEPSSQPEQATTGKASGSRTRKPRGPRGPKNEPAAAAEESSGAVDASVPVAQPEPQATLSQQYSAPDEFLHAQNQATETPVLNEVPVNNEPTVSEPLHDSLQTGVPGPFLKLGRWESTAESASGDLQFGSFGSFKDESSSGVSGGSAWASESTEPRTMDGAWASAQGSIASAPLNSYFPAAKLPAAPGSGSFDASKATAPPPGLDAQSQNKIPNQQRNKAETSQVLQQQPVANAPSANPYYHPAGVANPPGRGVPAASQYPQYGGFDLQQQFFNPNYPANQGQGAIGTAANPTVPTSSSSATAGQQQQQAQQQQAQPPFNPPPPFYFSPYFPGQFYYGQQGGMQNYYPQGRGVYPNRPYPNDPYGTGAPMYPDMYQQGQFADASGAYGTLPMHSGMPMQGQPAVGAGANVGSAGGKSKGAAGAVGSAQTPPAGADQAAQQHAAYGYAPYGRTDQWQYQGGWTGMVPFPAQGTTVPAQSAGANVTGAQPQQGTAGTAANQRASTTGNAYGTSGSFSSGARNTNSGTPSW